MSFVSVMCLLLCLLLLIVSVYSSVELEFEKFQSKFNKVYNSKEEKTVRFHAFSQNYAKYKNFLQNGINENHLSLNSMADTIHNEVKLMKPLPKISQINIRSLNAVTREMTSAEVEYSKRVIKNRNSYRSLRTNQLRRSQLILNQPTGNLTVDSIWTVSFVYLGTPNSSDPHVISCYWIPLIGQHSPSPLGLFTLNPLNGGQSPLTFSWDASTVNWDMTNYGFGWIRIIDDVGYYDEISVFLTNPRFKQVEIGIVPVPTWTGYLNWCSSTNVYSKSLCTPIRDQGTCGVCWAFTSAEVAETSYIIHRGGLDPIEMAFEQVIACATTAFSKPSEGPCAGGYENIALSWIMMNGLQNRSDYNSTWDTLALTGINPSPPSCDVDFHSKVAYKFDGFCKYFTNDHATAGAYLTAFGPATVAVDASNWQIINTNDIITDLQLCSPVYASSNHAVVIVGYDFDPIIGQEYWIARNQWGSSWGQNGYVKILKSNANVCGILNAIMFVAPCSTPIPAASFIIRPTSIVNISSTAIPSASVSTVIPTTPVSTFFETDSTYRFIVPVFGQIFHIGSVMPIRLNFTDCKFDLKIELTRDGVSVLTLNAASSFNITVVPWLIPLSMPSGDFYQIRVSYYDTILSSNLNFVSKFFKITAARLDFFATLPLIGSVYKPMSKVKTSWFSALSLSFINLKIFLNSTDSVNFYPVNHECDVSAIVCEVLLPAVPVGVYVFSFGATLVNGIILYTTTASFSISNAVAVAKLNPVVMSLSSIFILNIDYNLYKKDLSLNNALFLRDLSYIFSIPSSQIVIFSVSSWEFSYLTAISILIPTVNLNISVTSILPSSEDQFTIISFLSSVLAGHSSSFISLLYQGPITALIVQYRLTNAVVSLCSNGKVILGSYCGKISTPPPVLIQDQDSSSFIETSTFYIIIGVIGGVIFCGIFSYLVYICFFKTSVSDNAYKKTASKQNVALNKIDLPVDSRIIPELQNKSSSSDNLKLLDIQVESSDRDKLSILLGKYSVELGKLKDMGFVDISRNLRLLVKYEGKFELVISHLLK